MRTRKHRIRSGDRSTTSDSRNDGSRDDGSRDRGSAALELVILAPVLLALLGLVIAAGRTTIAQGSVDAAARDAARQASISLTPGQAQVNGQASALAALRQDGLDCVPHVVIVVSGPDAGFAVQPGQPASVTARVSCSVPLADLTLPGLPGSVQLTASFTSPLDVYRSR